MTTSSTPTPRYHDTGAKTLLSGVVPGHGQHTEALYADVEGVVDSIMAHPNVAPFVVAAHPLAGDEQPDAGPSFSGSPPSSMTRQATGAAARHPDRPRARAFTSADGRLKDPLLHILGLTRALDIPVANPAASSGSSNLLQLPLTPSTVFNFYNLLTPLPGNTALLGPEFGIYPPALAIQRANFIHGILNDWYSSSFPMATVLPTFMAEAADPATLVEAVNQRLMFGRMSTDLRDLITAATSAITDVSEAACASGARRAYLAAISSEIGLLRHRGDRGLDRPAAHRPDGRRPRRPPRLAEAGAAPLIGPAPTGHVLEGGVRPGEVLATVPIAGTTPAFTFQVPAGSFYLRLRSVSGAAVSRPSAEIRVHVGSFAGPSAPRSLSAYGRGSAVVLRWQNPFAGGEPTGVTVDVTQNDVRVASIPMPVTDTWTYEAVPAGTFGFTVRATNGAGTSGTSNRVTLTFPLSGCSSPRTPVSFTVAASGPLVTAHWQPSSSGTVRRATSSRPGAGTRTTARPRSGRSRCRGRRSPVRRRPAVTSCVKSENLCGASSFTSWQSVTVP